MCANVLSVFGRSEINIYSVTCAFAPVYPISNWNGLK